MLPDDLLTYHSFSIVLIVFVSMHELASDTELIEINEINYFIVCTLAF